MQCAHVTEWRHEERRVLVDFKIPRLDGSKETHVTGQNLYAPVWVRDRQAT